MLAGPGASRHKSVIALALPVRARTKALSMRRGVGLQRGVGVGAGAWSAMAGEARVRAACIARQGQGRRPWAQQWGHTGRLATAECETISKAFLPLVRHLDKFDHAVEAVCA